MSGWMDELVPGWDEGWMDGRVGEEVDRLVDGWMGWWLGGQMG